MKLRGIRSRMLLAALLPVMLVAGLLATVFILLRVGDSYDTHQQRARSLIRQVASASEYGLFSGNTASLQAVANGILREADVRSATIIDARGRVVLRAGRPSYEKLPELAALESGQSDPVSRIDLMVQPVLASQVRLDDTLELAGTTTVALPQQLGHVVMEFSRDSQRRRENEMLIAGIAITLGGVLFGGALAVMIGQGVVGPVMRVSQMIERIGKGDLSVRHVVSPSDPLHDLQIGLNQMASRLEMGRDDLEQRISSATRELRDKKEEAEFATLAKTRFLAAASHDLRQPTHALGMFVARLGQLPHDGQTRHLVNNLEASVRALQDLLDGLMDLSKLDAGAIQAHVVSVPLNGIFDQIQQAMAPLAADKGLRFKVRPTRVWVRSDPHLLQRILLNLVANAVRYTDHGSVLIACRAPTTAGQVRIEVWDSGIGIAPEHHENVFREFFQVGNAQRERAKGLGLGLNIVERTAGLLGHRFYLRSSLGRGTRFTLEVLLAGPQQASVPIEPVESLALASLLGVKILVVEDDPLASEGLAGLLESWGCEVATAASMHQAMEQLSLAGEPDIIVSDYRLPDGGNGIAAIGVLRQVIGHNVAACLLSGDTDGALVTSAREAGLTLLHKPVRPAKLRSLLRSLVRGDSQSGSTPVT